MIVVAHGSLLCADTGALGKLQSAARRAPGSGAALATSKSPVGRETRLCVRPHAGMAEGPARSSSSSGPVSAKNECGRLMCEAGDPSAQSGWPRLKSIPYWKPPRLLRPVGRRLLRRLWLRRASAASSPACSSAPCSAEDSAAACSGRPCAGTRPVTTPAAGRLRRWRVLRRRLRWRRLVPPPGSSFRRPV